MARAFLPPGTVEVGSGTSRSRFTLHTPAPCDCGRRHDRYVLTHGRRIVADAEAGEAGLRLLRSHVKLWVADHARSRVFVHAGVVGWRDVAVLLPGSSHAGKSTLVRELLRAGATYFSDDMAALDRRGGVHPYPDPLGSRARPGDPVPPGSHVDVPVAQFGHPVAGAPSPVGLVVITEHRPGERFRPDRISPARGAQALMAHAVAGRRRPALVLEAVGAACSDAAIWRGPRGDPDEVVSFVIAALGAIGDPVSGTRR